MRECLYSLDSEAHHVSSADNPQMFDDDSGFRARRRSVSDPKQTLLGVNVRNQYQYCVNTDISCSVVKGRRECPRRDLLSKEKEINVRIILIYIYLLIYLILLFFYTYA